MAGAPAAVRARHEDSASAFMTRRRIEVSGLVQGVGFRPYVYRLATERRLSGHILNTAAGVLIEVQGSPEAIESFLDSLPREAPPLARVTEVRVSELSANGDREFRILASEKSEACQTLISPDVAVCADCLRELFDPRDRDVGMERAIVFGQAEAVHGRLDVAL